MLLVLMSTDQTKLTTVPNKQACHRILEKDTRWFQTLHTIGVYLANMQGIILKRQYQTMKNVMLFLLGC